MKICAIIPSYRHAKAIPQILKFLREHDIFVFIIDDGNDEPVRAALGAMEDRLNGVVVHRFEKNLGKGSAVIAGMRLATTEGFTHALQIDADGQHDLSSVPLFLDCANKYPSALISGKPIYDASAPIGRKIGRWLTHIWVWLETLSFRISDSMCGFRVYPLAAVAQLLEKEAIGSRMEFDTDIMVRLFWQGVPPVMLPVGVTYPPENLSNFNLLKDNWRITKMHTRLFFTMLHRLRHILSNRPPPLEATKSWSGLSERGAYAGMKFCAMMCRILGKRGRKILLAPIVLYFYMVGAAQREGSYKFLTQALKRPPSWREGYQHFMNFGLRAIDVFLAWSGHLPEEIFYPLDPSALRVMKEDKCGSLIIVSHLGNVDVVPALFGQSTSKKLTILVHTKHAKNYNGIIAESIKDPNTNVLEVTDIGPETIIALKQQVEEGGLIVIAGDRTPVSDESNTVLAPFFGKKAAFPQGPWILASLLDCPVYLLFCFKENERYRLTLEAFADRILAPRSDRKRAIEEYAARYASRLEHYGSLFPFQWYNFYDFWGPQ